MPRSRTHTVVPHLVREEANALDLYLRYKGCHWNVAGAHFRDLHRLFDEHATVVLEMIDPLAERLRMLGEPAPYRSEELRAASSLAPERGLPGTTPEKIERLLLAHRMIVEGLEAGVRAASENGDIGTVDLLTGFVRAHQKMEWFLREIASGVAPSEEGPHGTLAGDRAGHVPSVTGLPIPSPAHPIIG